MPGRATPEGVVLRTATTADVLAVCAFGAAVLPAHYAQILGEQGASAQLTWWTPARLAPAVAVGRVHLAVEAPAGPVAGVCETGVVAGEQVVHKLYVAAATRGRGVGTALLRRAVDHLPAGTHHVLVAHVAANARAAAFYEREGYAVLDTGPLPPGDPAAALVWRRLDRRGRRSR